MIRALIPTLASEALPPCPGHSLAARAKLTDQFSQHFFKSLFSLIAASLTGNINAGRCLALGPSFPALLNKLGPQGFAGTLNTWAGPNLAPWPRSNVC